MRMMRRAISMLLILAMMSGMVIISAGATPTFKFASATNAAYADDQGYDFRQWMQDEARWASVPLGSSNCTIGSSGCTMTSLTKLIIEAGLANPTEINPATVVKYVNQNNGFTATGNIDWPKVDDFCTNVLGKTFHYQNDYRAFAGNADTENTLTAGANPTYAQMIDWMNQGYHMVLNVKGAAHWIAVDEYETRSRDDGKIYVMDSWRDPVEERFELTLDDYLDKYYTHAGYTGHDGQYDRVTVFKTDPADTDNANPNEYNTNDYRHYSRYDSRWATTVLDEPSSSTAEYVGQWGQALLALTKSLIQAGVISSSSTPNDVLATLQSKGLIGSADGIISWSGLSSYDSTRISTQTAPDSTSITPANIISDIQSGKHYILRLASSGFAEGTWVTIDEPATMATGQIYVLTSGADAGSKTLSQVQSALGVTSVAAAYSYTTTSVNTSYVQLNYSAEHADVTASYALDGDVISVSIGGYIPSGTEVTFTAEPAAGYTNILWNGGSDTGATYTAVIGADTTVTVEGVTLPYAITYTPASTGFSYSVAPPDTAYHNSSVEFTLAMTEHYLPTVSYTAGGVTTALEPTIDGSDYTYRFTMPEGNVEISVTVQAFYPLTYTKGTGLDSLSAYYTVDYTDTPIVSGTTLIPGGAPVTLGATLSNGYAATSWTYSSGTEGTADHNTYTLNIAGDTVISAEGVPQSYSISYTAETDTCGFYYGAKPVSAAYNTDVSFTVNPSGSDYTLTVTAVDAYGNDVSLTSSGNTYTFTQPACDVTVTVTAEADTYTVYLNPDVYKNGSETWYAYTWTKGDTNPFDIKWIPGTVGNDGNVRFDDDVYANVIFVRVNTSKLSSLDTSADLDANKHISDLIWNQSDDLDAAAAYDDNNSLYTLTSWNQGTTYGNFSGSWSIYANNTVYLRPQAIDAHANYTYSPDEYYAWTWKAEKPGYWATKTVDETLGLIQFSHVSDNIIFYRLDPSAELTNNTSSSSVWGYTADIAVDTSSGYDLYVLDRYYYANESGYVEKKMIGNWDKTADIDDAVAYCLEHNLDTKYAYQYWTTNDARWNKVHLGTTTDSGNLTGSWTIAQALAKLALQADQLTSQDVSAFAVKALNASGLHDFPAVNRVDSGVNLTLYSKTTDLTQYPNYDYAYSMYLELLEGKHILLRVHDNDTNADEWVVVDEERTLLNNNAENIASTGAVIYILRTTDTMSNNTNCFMSTSTTSIDGATRLNGYIKQKYVYIGGTTPGLTRDFDYRRWSRLDGRWKDKVMTTSTYTMERKGALVVALEKMLVQAGVHSDADYTPLDLYNYVIGHNHFDSYANINWADVNSYTDGFYTFENNVDSNGFPYLKFAESITAGGVTRTGYPRKVGADNAYRIEDEYQVILEAIKQGYHMILEVSKTGVDESQTWLPIDEKLSLEMNDIYIMDSKANLADNADINLREAGYTYLFRVIGYKGSTTPIPVYTTGEDEEGNPITIKNPELKPSTYFGTTTDPYMIVKDTGSLLTVSVSSAVKGLTYRFKVSTASLSDAEDTIDTGYVDVLATSSNMIGDVLTYTFPADEFAFSNSVGYGGPVYLAVKAKYTKEGSDTVVYSNVVSNSMTYTVVTGGSYKFIYQNRLGNTAYYTEKCDGEYLEKITVDGTVYLAPKMDSGTVAAVAPGSSKVSLFKQTANWTRGAGVSRAMLGESFVTTIDASSADEVFSLTYYVYNESGVLTLGGAESAVFNLTAVDLDPSLISNKPAGSDADDVFLGWYEAQVDGDGLVSLTDHCLSTLPNFGMIITKDLIIAPKYGTPAEDTSWHAYIDDSYFTVEKTDDPDGGKMYVDFILRYLSGEGTDVLVPDGAKYGVIFVWSEEGGDTTAKAASMSAYATNATLLSGRTGSAKDGDGKKLKVINRVGSSLSELNRLDMAIVNGYDTFKGCPFTAYAYITVDGVTSVSAGVGGTFPA